MLEPGEPGGYRRQDRLAIGLVDRWPCGQRTGMRAEGASHLDPVGHASRRKPQEPQGVPPDRSGAFRSCQRVCLRKRTAQLAHTLLLEKAEKMEARLAREAEIQGGGLPLDEHLERRLRRVVRCARGFARRHRPRAKTSQRRALHLRPCLQR